MFNVIKEELEWGGRPLVLETGRIARQADGAVLATYGETTVLAAVVAESAPRPDQGFFPLTVHYQERTYAAGKIPGGYFKREGRPSEKETLVSRLIDRTIRPMFADGFMNDTQVTATVLSHDLENDPDVVAMIATYAALAISGIPFSGPLAAARVGYVNGDYLLNPSLDVMGDSGLDLVVAGSADAVVMVESEAKELSEDVMLGGVMFGHDSFAPVMAAISKLGEKAGKPVRSVTPADESAQVSALEGRFAGDLTTAYQIADKTERQNAVAEVRSRALEADGSDGADMSHAFKSLEKKIVRGAILKTGRRIDGRDLETVRPITAEVGVLPRAHGSALFTRGETQALVVATLGTGEDEQFVDALSGTYRESFLLHYNFPPYSVGETGRIGFTGRREIGHGKLAWRAVRAVLPPREDFPYTLRLVSEITESNGSSSMASVCGASLAMMDAGISVTRPVAGIAMGLIKQGDECAILSDIIGDEDHLGDMDFKVAGTEKGVTSLQMDIKISGITRDIMAQALQQAHQGRQMILVEMGKALTSARPEMGRYAPQIEMITIPVDKIRDIIGTGGKVIREIVETTGAKVDVGDDGTIKVASSNAESIRSALNWINSITAEPEPGAVYDGTVVKIMDFGAFVNFFGRRDGLVHVSQLADHRVERVGDIVNEGDKVKVKLLDIDERGKARLSMKAVDQNTGEEIPGFDSPPPPRKRSGPPRDRGGDRDSWDEPRRRRPGR